MYEIEWTTVRNKSKTNRIVKPSDEVRRETEYVADKYYAKVIVPWYRDIPDKVRVYLSKKR